MCSADLAGPLHLQGFGSTSKKKKKPWLFRRLQLKCDPGSLHASSNCSVLQDNRPGVMLAGP